REVMDEGGRCRIQRVCIVYDEQQRAAGRACDQGVTDGSEWREESGRAAFIEMSEDTERDARRSASRRDRLDRKLARELAACFAGEARLADAGRAGDDDATTCPNGVNDE